MTGLFGWSLVGPYPIFIYCLYDSSAVGAGAGDDVSFEARSAVVLFFELALRLRSHNLMYYP